MNEHQPTCAVRLTVGILLVSIVWQPASLSARTIVAAGRATVWKYLDSATEPGPNWRTKGFDDSNWKSGEAPLGFGETRLTTRVNAGIDLAHRPMTTWFRHEFEQPDLKPGESLVVSCCVDDGAIIYLNGKEIGRINMPPGKVGANTPALKTISNDDEGFYARLRLPAQAQSLGRANVLAVEVHQATAFSSDLFFDLALKVLPPLQSAAKASPAAQPVVNTYSNEHYVPAGIAIPDGYIDGGRGMNVDGEGRASSGREILVVDRSRDQELAADLAFARSPELKALTELERVQRLAARVDGDTTPPGGLRLVGDTTKQLEDEFTNKPVLIGDWVDQCQAGVCRHRALLFKLLADEAGLRSALVRGNYLRKDPPGIPHAWNEVTLDDGQRVLVDVMHNGGKPKFLPLTDADVIQHYRKVDGTPWYGTKAD